MAKTSTQKRHKDIDRGDHKKKHKKRPKSVEHSEPKKKQKDTKREDHKRKQKDGEMDHHMKRYKDVERNDHKKRYKDAEKSFSAKRDREMIDTSSEHLNKIKRRKHDSLIPVSKVSLDYAQPKTSDTYWNKYADKLGIRIEDSLRKSPNRSEEVKEMAPKAVAIKKPVLDPLSTRTGGAYIPPAKLKMMSDQIKDKSSIAFQRLSWEALKKSINGLINKVNVSNIAIIVRELIGENVVRGKGILCRALMQAQAFSQTFTHVYAAMAAIINSKFQVIGELLLRRLVIQFRRGYEHNDKNACLSSCRFIAHLINQQVAHEIVALEILTMLLEGAKSIDDTEEANLSRNCAIELAVAFLKECGMKLTEVVPKGMLIITSALRDILHEGKLDARYQYMIEVLFSIQKAKFKDFPSITSELDLIEDDDQFTHIIELGGKLDSENVLNVFKNDPDYLKNEEWYKEIKESLLGANENNESDLESGSESEEEASTDEEKDEEKILDMTETNMISFRRSVYLTIQSSLNVDEVVHKLLKADIKPGWHPELCNMIIDCCAQQRTFEKFFALIAGKFCQINAGHRETYQNLFKETYDTCHRLETERLRNVAKLFSHLLFSDNISWEVMQVIKLNQADTNSSSRIFLKILFTELVNFMGLTKVNERFRDPTLSYALESLLPRDNPVNTKFAINFFTTIGLGGLTDDLREFLRSVPKPTAIVAPVQHKAESSSSSSESSSSSDSSSSSSSSDSSSSSSSSETSDSTSSSSSDSSSSSSSSDSDSSSSSSSSSDSDSD